MESEKNSNSKNITDQVNSSTTELESLEKLKSQIDKLDQQHEMNTDSTQHGQQISIQQSVSKTQIKDVETINTPLSFENNEKDHDSNAQFNNTAPMYSNMEKVITNDVSCTSVETDTIANQETVMQTDIEKVNNVGINLTEENVVETNFTEDSNTKNNMIVDQSAVPIISACSSNTEKTNINSTEEKVVETNFKGDSNTTNHMIVDQATAAIISACSSNTEKTTTNDVSCTSMETDTIANQETDIEKVNNVGINSIEEKVVETNFKDGSNTANHMIVDQATITASDSLTSTLQIQAVDNVLPNVEAAKSKVSTSLSLLAEYASDESGEEDGEVLATTCIESDTDSVVEVPVSVSNNYRNQVFEVDSDNNSSSSEEDSDDNYLTQIRKTIDKSMKTETDDEEDECIRGSHDSKRPQLKVRGELMLEDLPPIQDLHITVPEDECVELGEVRSIVDQLILVSVLPNSVLVDLDTVLFLEKGKKVLGEVFDVLGQVADPLYCVRFNSNKQIQEKEIKVGDKVYVAPKTKYTQFVVLANLIGVRGSDASWENDIEPPPHYLDYSDDEEERESRVKLRNKDRPNDHNDLKKRTRINSDAPTTSTKAAPPTNYRTKQSVRKNVRGGYGNNSDNTPSQSPLPAQQRNQNKYNSGSWHSNYYPPAYYQQPHAPQYPLPSQYGPYTNNAMPPPYFNSYPQSTVPHHMQHQYPPPMPQPMQHQHTPTMPQPMQHQYPPPPPASMPHPMQHQHQPPMPQPIQTPPPTYVVNPFAIRPSVLSGNNTQHYQEPPPPGSSSN